MDTNSEKVKYLIESIEKKNRLFLIPYKNRVKKDERYLEFTNRLISVIYNYAELNNDEIDYVIESYNNYYLNYLELQQQFNKTGSYKYKNYADLDQDLDEVFHKDYIYVLLISFLTTSYRYDMMEFVSEAANKYLKNESEVGLEIGFGTGIELAERIDYFVKYDIYEINKYSEQIFNLLYKGSTLANYNNAFYEFDDVLKYSYVQLIELMEHLEEPKKYIDRSHRILKSEGIVVFTAAVNMANIDHIYLFDTIQSVRDLIDDQKWEVLDSKCFINSIFKYSEEKIKELIEGKKTPYIITFVIRKNRCLSK